MTAKQVVSKLLLAFVLVSIGFALGKETALRRARALAQESGAAGGEPAPATQPVAVAQAKAKVVVYYLHAPIRCVTCNRIEKLARETLQEEFAAELSNGRVVWQVADFQERDDLARKYDVTGSTIVVVQVADGKELRFQRLEKVWELVSDPVAFSKYVSTAIRASLPATPTGGTP